MKLVMFGLNHFPLIFLVVLKKNELLIHISLKPKLYIMKELVETMQIDNLSRQLSESQKVQFNYK